MNNIANLLVNMISKSNPEFSDLELKKMEYGLVCFMNEITKFIPYYIIFWILSLEKYYLICILFFCPIRLFSGGYHAKTYWGCFFITFIIFLSIVIFGKYVVLENKVSILILIISLVFISIFAPVDNINKRIKSEKRRFNLKIISIIVTLILIILCYFIPYKFLSTAVASITSATIMMIIGKLNIK